VTVYSRTETPVELDWRFAELVMRVSGEPDLGRRYTEDPVSVLAEFGLAVAGADEAPKLLDIELTIEDLDDAGSAPVTLCYCVNDERPKLSAVSASLARSY